MPGLKYKVNCKTCQLSKHDEKLRKRIRYAAYKREQGDETLTDIAGNIGVSVGQIYNHVKKHMTDITEAYQSTHELKVAKKKEEFRAKAQGELELALKGDVLDSVEARPEEVIALDDYIAQAKALIDKGQLKITATNFLAAVKIRTDYRNKQDNTKLDYMKTIYALSSGKKPKENTNVGTGSTTITGLDNGGTEQPRSLYHQTAGSETA